MRLPLFLPGVVFLVTVVLPAGADDPAERVLRSEALTVRFDEIGRIRGARFFRDASEHPVTAETRILGCRFNDEVEATSLPGGGLRFVKRFATLDNDLGELWKGTVVERFMPHEDGIRWEVEIRGEGAPWSTPVETRIHWPDAERSLFWTAWGDPRPDGGDWIDPLRPGPFRDRAFLYGGRHAHKDPNTFALPMASLLDPARDDGLTVALSPEDLVLNLRMRTTRDGDLIFAREHHRIDANRAVCFALDLVAHPADWRGGVQWARPSLSRIFRSARTRSPRHGRVRRLLHPLPV